MALDLTVLDTRYTPGRRSAEILAIGGRLYRVVETERRAMRVVAADVNDNLRDLTIASGDPIIEFAIGDEFTFDGLTYCLLDVSPHGSTLTRTH